MPLIRVKVTSDPAFYTTDEEGNTVLTDDNRFTIVVNNETIIEDAVYDEAAPVLDYYTPDFWGPLIVLGNLQAAARDGKIQFEHDFIDDTLEGIRF